MPIFLDIKPNKNEAPRIAVIRKTKGKAGELIQKNLGVLPADLEQFRTKFKGLLDNEELYQLENYWHNLHFNKIQLNTEAHQFARELFYFATPFHHALMKLWQLAMEEHIDFNPRKVMLTAILNKAKAVERELNEKRQEKINVLEALGIDIHRFNQQAIKERLYSGGQALFKALSALNKPLNEVAAQFNHIAQTTYNKHVNLTATIIQSYAAKPKRYPRWYCCVAIDILLAYGKNPLDILSASKVAGFWILLRCQRMSLEEAQQLFFKTFLLSEDAKAEVSAVFKDYYADP